MALKQANACAAVEKHVGQVINKSLCEIPGGWLCLAQTEAGKRLVCVTAGDASGPSLLNTALLLSRLTP